MKGRGTELVTEISHLTFKQPSVPSSLIWILQHIENIIKNSAVKVVNVQRLIWRGNASVRRKLPALYAREKSYSRTSLSRKP
jgi:hypothetical protein